MWLLGLLHQKGRLAGCMATNGFEEGIRSETCQVGLCGGMKRHLKAEGVSSTG